MLFLACAKPEPPKLTPKQASVTGVNAATIDFEVEVDAANPNSFAITARTVKAKVTLDGRIDLGEVSVPAGVELPANGTKTVKVPLKAKWSDIGSLAVLGAQNRPIPYTIAGTVAIGSEKLNVDVPFTLEGTIKHEQLVEAAMRSIPAIPSGLPGLLK